MDIFKTRSSAIKKTILIVDDEEDFCFFVKLNLEQTGKFDVLTATSGAEGIQMAISINLT